MSLKSIDLLHYEIDFEIDNRHGDLIFYFNRHDSIQFPLTDSQLDKLISVLESIKTKRVVEKLKEL